MLELSITEVFIDAAILSALLYLIGKHEADFSFAKVAMVTAGIGLGSFLIHTFLFDKIGWLVLVATFALSAGMITTFCWLPLPKTILVVVLFSLVQVGVKFGVGALLHGMFADTAQPELLQAQPAQAQPQPQAQPQAEPQPQVEPSPPASVGGIPTDWEAARKALKLEGAMLNAQGNYVAIVNGEIVEVGDTISCRLSRLIYTWQVREISKHDIDFKPLDAEPE